MGNVNMEAKDVHYRGGNKPMSVEEAIKAAGTEITPEEKTWIDSIPALTTSNAGKTDQDVIAPEFDAEAGVYAVGDKVMYEGKLYNFTTAHETPGDWDSTEVSETSVADELNSLESGLIDLDKVILRNITANQNTDVTIGSGSDIYTVPADAWYYLEISANNGLTTVLNVNGYGIFSVSGGKKTASLPFKAGTKLSYWCSGGASGGSVEGQIMYLI